MSERRYRAAAVLTGIAVMGGSLLAATPASAATETTIGFVGESAVSAPFGGDWSFAVSTTGSVYGYEWSTTGVLGPTTGTVSVTVSGVGGTFASGIPIQPDGVAYVSQPQDRPLLPAGEYEVTAIFVPGTGTNHATSQTSAPAHLTITALGLAGTAAILDDPAVSDVPYIEASLTGEYLEAMGGAPAGTWEFLVKNGKKELYSTSVPQRQGASAPVQVGIPAELPDGADLTLETTFTPSEDVAGGIEMAPVPAAQYTTPSSGLLDALAARIPFPTWLVFVIGGLLVLLVATVVTLGVLVSRRAGTDDEDAAPIDAPADDAATQVLGSWSLAEDAPTELITPAELDRVAQRHAKPVTDDAADTDESADTDALPSDADAPTEVVPQRDA